MLYVNRGAPYSDIDEGGEESVIDNLSVTIQILS